MKNSDLKTSHIDISEAKTLSLKSMQKYITIKTLITLIRLISS